MGVVFYAAALNICARSTRYYLYKPNEYVDVYDDPRSRHWLGLRPQCPMLQLAHKRFSWLRIGECAKEAHGPLVSCGLIKDFLGEACLNRCYAGRVAVITGRTSPWRAGGRPGGSLACALRRSPRRCRASGGPATLTRDRFPWSTIARCQPGRYSAATTRCQWSPGAGALGQPPRLVAWVMPRATTSSRPSSPASATALHHRSRRSSRRHPAGRSISAPGTPSRASPGRSGPARPARPPPGQPPTPRRCTAPGAAFRQLPVQVVRVITAADGAGGQVEVPRPRHGPRRRSSPAGP